MSGQSVLDRVNAARHTITGSDVAKSVFKATTEEILGPKKKHLDYLLQCTHTEHINIPELADMVIVRATNANWVVVFKTLVTCHHLMVYGNERFIRYLATKSTIFNLEEYADKGGTQGYEMSIFVRKYAKYLNQKAYSYRSMAFDFCRAKRGKEDGVLRTMSVEKLLKALPQLQSHLDALLDFEMNSTILSNGVINSAFLLLFKDCIRLFACYNDGIINLLDKFFEMPKKECKQAFDLYKKFLIRMDKVAGFLQVAEQVGVDKGEIPDLAKFRDVPEEYKKAPSSLLEALESHLASLDGKTKANWSRPQAAQQVVSAFTTSLAADEKEKERALEEEKERLAALKQARLKEFAEGSPTHQPATPVAAPQPVQQSPAAIAPNPFITPAPQPVAIVPTHVAPIQAAPIQAMPIQAMPIQAMPIQAAPIQAMPIQAAPSQDLFSAAPDQAQNQTQSSGSNDLIGLNTNPGMNAVLQAQRAQQTQQQQNTWANTNGFPNNNTIGANFESAFGAPVQGSIDIMQPMNRPESIPTIDPLANAEATDLDNTISSLATNLNIRSGPSPKKTDHQWSKSAVGNVRTGGQAWQPKQLSTTTTTWQQQPMAGGQQYMEQSSAPPQPNMGANMGMNMGMRPVGVPPAGAYAQPIVGGGVVPPGGYPYQTPPQQQMQPSDPFGPF